MSAPFKEYERYLELVDREACDEPLNAAESEFCRLFEERYPDACPELEFYKELEKLNPPPDASSRALVDRALARLDSEEAEHSAAEAKVLRRSQTRAWPTLIGVAAFAIGAGYALLERPSQGRGNQHASAPLVRAELVYASGLVNVSGSSATVGRALLSQGSVIETTDGGACILIDSDINVCLGPDSRVRLTELAGPARGIELQAGKVAARLSAQPEGMSLSIMADGITSTAIGTAFSVERADDHSVVTTVLNGKVRVSRGEEATIVNAHERSISPSGRGATTAGPKVVSVRRTEEAPSWVLLGPTVLWHDPVAATLEVRGEPVGADAWLDDQWLGSTPVSSLIPVGEHRLIVRKDHQELLARELHVHAGDTEDVRYEHAPLQAVAQAQAQTQAQSQAGQVSGPGRVPAHANIEDDDKGHALRKVNPARPREVSANRELVRAPLADVENPVDGSELLRQARQAKRLGQFQAAADLYEKLIGSSTESVEERTVALVFLGQLRLNQLNDPSGAIEPLETYLRSGGPMEPEARVMRIQALHELNRSKDEGVAIEEYLNHHPRNFDAKRLRARLDELHASTH